VGNKAKRTAQQIILDVRNPLETSNRHWSRHSEVHSEITQQDALAGMIVALPALPKALNALGMRSEGSTVSADCAGQVIDRLDEHQSSRPPPPTGIILEGMLHEAAIAIGIDKAGSTTVDALDGSHFQWKPTPDH